MARWHYRHNGHDVGPVDQSLLLDLVSNGAVGPGDMARQDGMVGWRAVSKVPELAAVAVQPVQGGFDRIAYTGDNGTSAVDSVTAAAVDYYAPQAPVADYSLAQGTSATANAGFWLRLVAHIIDEIIVGVPAIFVVCFIFGTDALRFNNPYMREMRPFIDIGFIVASWLYHALQESSASQATFGKRMLGIRVADMDGQRIGFMRASVRFFGKILSGLICSIGYFMAGFTERKQGLHDMIAGTFVVTTWR